MKKYTNEDIRLAAYYIWEQLGKPWGKEDECWNMALEQLMIYDTTNCSKKTKCATTKKCSSTSTTKATTKTTKASAIKSTNCTTSTKAKTTLKTPSTTRTSVKASSSNTTDFSHFRSNAGSLKSKVSLNTNKNIDSNYSLKVAKKSLI